VELSDQALRLREHDVEVLDEVVRWKTAFRGAEIHRAARRDDADAELARRLHLRLHEALAPGREHVVVVEHGRAPG
jgi:hypothetical protein